MAITDAAIRNGAVELAIDDRLVPLGFRWLRDHCRCATCYDARTHQRITPLARGHEPARVSVVDGGAALVVEWPEAGHRSRFSDDFLADVLAGHREPDPAAEPWDAATFSEPSMPAQRFLTDEGAVADGLLELRRVGVLFIDDVPPTPEATRRVVERIGYVRHTIFGGMWEFSADESRADSAYTSTELPLHTDGTYMEDAPGVQVLHCIELEASGGESVIADGLRVAEDLGSRHPGAFNTLSSVPVTGRYVEEGVHLTATRPIIRLSGDRIAQISYNHADRAPMYLPEPDMSRFYDAVEAWEALLAENRFRAEFRLTPGRMFLWDNWRVLHARKAYRGRRHMVGCYLNREDVLSRMRVVGA